MALILTASLSFNLAYFLEVIRHFGLLRLGACLRYNFSYVCRQLLLLASLSMVVLDLLMPAESAEKD